MVRELSNREIEIEEIVKFARVNLEIEGLELTDEEVEDGRKILRGEATARELVEIYFKKLVANNG